MKTTVVQAISLSLPSVLEIHQTSFVTSSNWIGDFSGEWYRRSQVKQGFFNEK
jgi:hypothetical protein